VRDPEHLTEESWKTRTQLGRP